ncbi:MULTISPECIES: hypothetical protein [Methylobacterium]|jgi:hypothetical protein|uniref:Uncharacterized protein n=1 Tax=Methylobacterium fujisawaense TaxID=107400 RepID=A0ABR6D9G2_9HYPH|nr:MULTISPECIES: hypothetical protein [Methylobacterium]MBA9062717.1 hypothetical protein [Methylobacterium fujisawaense]MBP31271.1 hypothetical protein [Methylobacterium sp.]
MFESMFWGAALVALIGSAAIVAIGASFQPGLSRRNAVDPRVPDPRRTFGRKRRWRRPPRVARRIGPLPMR